MKLAYINHFEKRLTKEYGYDIIDVLKLSGILKEISGLHPFIEHYLEYIVETFKKFIVQIPEKIFIKKDYTILENGQAQQYLIDILYKNLDGKLEQIYFSNGSSFGRPWTQLYIGEKLNVYGEKPESIFWRIDIRSDKYYIRLNQYSNISSDYKEKKTFRMNKLREIALGIREEFPFLKEGKLIDKGTYESEIIIFFFKENNLEYLFKNLPFFSIKFIEKYKILNTDTIINRIN